MKGYESYFHRCQNPEYADRYVDYGLHKDKLRKFYKRRRQLSKILRDEEGRLSVDAFSRLTGEEGDSNNGLGSAVGYVRYGGDDGREEKALVNKDDALLRLSVMERKEFSSLLEEQASNAAIFYSSTLIPEVSGLIENADFDAASRNLLEAVAFACVNVITFRQLLIRYDAFCRTFDGMPLNEWHLQRSVLDVDHPVHGLFQLEGVGELEKRIVIGMQQKQMDLEAVRQKILRRSFEGEDGMLVLRNDVDEKNAPSNSVADFTMQIQSFVYLLEKTDTSLDKAVAGHVVFKDRLVALGMRMRQYLLFGFQSRKLFTSYEYSYVYISLSS